MPVRRKKSKARLSDVKAWACFLCCGGDFFDDLAAIGLNEETAVPLAEGVWREIGEAVVQYYDDLHIGYSPPVRPFWAEEQFGQPGLRRRCR